MRGVSEEENTAALESKYDPSLQTGGTATEKLQEKQLKEDYYPPEKITTTTITWERAQQLATTRRRRYSEFAVGGLLSGLPGTVQTMVTYLDESHRIMPSDGRIVQILITIFFAALAVISAFQITEPVSRDFLAKTFPVMTRKTGWIRRLRKWFCGIKDDCFGPL